MKRKPLDAGQKLSLLNAYEDVEYVIIGGPIEDGSGSIVYRAKKIVPYIRDKKGNEEDLLRTIIIQESYPESLRYYVEREGSGALTPDANHKNKFEIHKMQFFHFFTKQQQFHNQIKDPHILTEKIYYGNETFYSVMEMQQGAPLAESSDKIKTLHDAASIALQLAYATRNYHDAGLCHLDIKPTTILLHSSRNKKEGFSISLLDFGSSRSFEEISAGRIDSYTEKWSAPELKMMRTTNIGASTDIYSLGAVLYWILTGEQYDYYSYGIIRRRPFDMKTENKFQESIDTHSCNFINSILEKCLGLLPSDRYQEIDGELESQLEQLCSS